MRARPPRKDERNECDESHNLGGVLICVDGAVNSDSDCAARSLVVFAAIGRLGPLARLARWLARKISPNFIEPDSSVIQLVS